MPSPHPLKTNALTVILAPHFPRNTTNPARFPAFPLRLGVLSKMVMDHIDWPGIRAAAVSIGIRPAARAAAADLPPAEQNRFVERVLKRASRQKWEAAKVRTMSAAATLQPAHARPLSANVRTGADSAASLLANQAHKTKQRLSKAALALSAKCGKVPILTAQDALAVAKFYAVTHEVGKQGAPASVTLNLGFFGI